MAWSQLTQLAANVLRHHSRELLNDPDRFENYSLRIGKTLIDFSRQRVTSEILNGLVQLAHESNLPQRIEEQYLGEIVNLSEHRRAWHTALRACTGELPETVLEPLKNERERLLRFAEDVRTGRILGSTGLPLKHIVNVGIGGSYYGQQLACDALGDGSINVRFLSNLSPRHMRRTLHGLQPESTLFIVVSKSFSTPETIRNAHACLSWFIERTGQPDLAHRHFAVVTSNKEKLRNLNFPTKECFEMPDWIGGRFSLWSAAGLSVAIAAGTSQFIDLLDGAARVDHHFRTTNLRCNAPVLLALISLWNTNFLGASTHAILTYDDRLRFFLPYVQQLEMESNGKSARCDGTLSDVHTTPVIWGGQETEGQHSFHQFLHQGTRSFSADFIASIDSEPSDTGARREILANCLAQSRVLLTGTEDEALPLEQRLAGNHPSTLFLLDDVDAQSLGELLALFEHKVACLGFLWGINPFDQWGVKRGKEIAIEMSDALETGNLARSDPTTRALVEAIRMRTI